MSRRKNSTSYKDDWGRDILELTPDMPENYIARSCLYPFQGHTSSQRRDLMNNFEQATIIPVDPDIPIVDSMMAPDMMKYSSCIKELRGGKVTLLAKFSYQLRTIYVYLHNDKVFLYDDNCGTVVRQRAVNVIHTDFDKINVGDTIDLDDPTNDTFYLKYPSFFNPANGLIGYGKNILTRIDIDLDNSQDSVRVSESFLDKFISRKTKSVTLTLNNKKIISKYENLFPKIGEIIEEQFLCKLVSSDGDMFNLSQSSNIPAGEEDDTVVMDQTSILTSIEVYCNEPIDDPILEKYRKELLKFRFDLFYKLDELKRKGYKFDDNVNKYYANYGIGVFRTNHTLVDKPMIVIRIDSLSRPSVGWKFSNRYGGKYTIQSVYKDGFIKDEFGRNVELTYGALGIINRMIPSAMLEVWFSAFQEYIKQALINKTTSIEKVIEFYKFLYTTLGHSKEFNNLKLSNKEWETLVIEKHVPIILMPISTYTKLGKLSKIRTLAKQLFGYRKSKVFINGKHCKQESTIGYMYTVRLSQDPEVQTSAVAFPEIDSRGLIKDDDDSKKKGLSVLKRKSSKHCVQTMHITTNIVPDAVSYDWLCEADSVMNIVEEHGEAIGIGLYLGSNTEEYDE